MPKSTFECAEVGCPPKKKPSLSAENECHLRFTIHDFEKRTSMGEAVESPALWALGYDWKISVYSKVDNDDGGGHENIICKLCCQPKNREQRVYPKFDAYVACEGKFDTVDTDDDIIVSRSNNTMKFPLGARARVLSDSLKHGSLEINIGIFTEDCNYEEVWYPEELQRQDDLVELYQDASSESSDIQFSVGERVFRVHKSILSLRCKKLYEIAMGHDNGFPIPIPSVKDDVFKIVLDYAYSILPEIGNEDTAKDILVAADRFECIPLKLYAESILVDKFLCAGNAVALMILADSHMCALLKEASMNMFVQCAPTVTNGEAWSQVKESNKFLEELLVVAMNGNKKRKRGQDEIDEKNVTTLRLELEAANLDLDGSREILVERLRTHKSSESE